MVQCFAPDCNHQSERDLCSFFRFPKSPSELIWWKKLLRREDREPGSSARVCSCHFRGGLKVNGPEIFRRNADKLFPQTHTRTPKAPKKKKTTHKENEELVVVADFVKQYENSNKPSTEKESTESLEQLKAQNVILQVDLENLQAELEQMKLKEKYQRDVYSVESLNDEVVCMETGLPNKAIFAIVVAYVKRLYPYINYYYKWKVERITLDDQVFIALMKMRQCYTNLHLAELFHCSTATISNIVLTFVNVLYVILYKECLRTVPSKEKCRSSMPESFSVFSNCRMVIDCTDMEIAIPGLMNEQKLTYSSYRGMNSFKTLIGVAPNAVITYVSKPFPGSISDKSIVKHSGILDHFTTGDLVLADKGFLISDMVPNGVSVNVPPFLYNSKFTESEVKMTKTIARCRIHVERANGRLKDFKILKFIPPYLRCYSEVLLKACAGLVNLQNSLIKEIRDTVEFE